MPNVSVHFHSVVGVTAHRHEVKETTWVDIKFFDANGKSQEITIFFDDHEFAGRFAEAVKTLNFTDPSDVESAA